ncbi:type IV pilin N-terminal domain-containing protein [Methanomicrobium antiquum]|uniref:Type IV pilin N-terminal domain-containing protein n=1 Tax=Methanomicrobium antiquum TaxID=487686 RepID=A0AAF0FRT9_9EURY|nr:type IV pilin N-terminal domain-containing protein [Methanomicrobium antiquum]WFN37334.1 type IV pilin N-terminal domain-containing protein [Methanomicrobium antiquum]
MKKERITQTEAVSPVVGVMLMLVVTIIIAAVVSGFAGGLVSGQEKAPVASFECNIVNDGTWGGSGFNLRVLSTEEGIPTKDIQLVTSWKASDGTSNSTIITGPMNNANVHYDCGTGIINSTYVAPLGFGQAIEGWKASGSYSVNQHYGNYTLMAGTTMHNSPYGWSASYGGYGVSSDTRYEYTDGTKFSIANGDQDSLMAILGIDWYHLQPGDVVSVKLVHVPTGSVIFDKNVVVEG